MYTHRTIKWLLAISSFILVLGSFILLLTACSTRHVPAAATHQSVHIPLGTTLLAPKSASSVFTVAWSPDGTRIASGSWDTTVQIWNAATGQHRYICRGHDNIIGALVWSPDGQRIASVDDHLRVWQAS